MVWVEGLWGVAKLKVLGNVAWTPVWAPHSEGSYPAQPLPTRSCPDGHH